MHLQTRAVGFLGTNCYILQEEISGEIAVIDPGQDAPEIDQAIADFGGNLKYILLTHGHFDHILGVPVLQQKYPQAQVAIHMADTAFLSDPQKSMPLHYGRGQAPIPLDIQLNDGDVLSLGDTMIRVLHTPGHTGGSVCYLLPAKNWMFSGDTLFYDTIGNCNFPGGDMSQMEESLQRLADLTQDYHVYPGHEKATTLSREKRDNPYMPRKQI